MVSFQKASLNGNELSWWIRMEEDNE